MRIRHCARVFLLSCVFTIRLTAGNLPNILWLTAEDIGPHLGCYGDSYATSMQHMAVVRDFALPLMP